MRFIPPRGQSGDHGERLGASFVDSLGPCNHVVLNLDLTCGFFSSLGRSIHTCSRRSCPAMVPFSCKVPASTFSILLATLPDIRITLSGMVVARPCFVGTHVSGYSYAAAVVMALAYGKIPESFDDPIVQAVNRCLTRLGFAMRPGIWRVDAYPFLRYDGFGCR